MKYIRTKDGIYDIEKSGGILTITKVYDVDETLRIKYENTNEPQQVGDRVITIDGKDYKIIDSNVADTIEKLCDEFICVLKNGEHNRVMLSTAKEYAKGKMEIYGAIWTNKGLIYVAKMNERGCLELL